MARTFRHGRQTRIMADGVDLSCYLKEASISSTIDTPETTAFCDTIKQWVTGLPDYSASLSGMFEATTTTGTENGTDTVLFNKFGAEAFLNVVLANEGSQAGRRSRGFQGIITSYNIQNTVADMVALNMDMKVTGQLYVMQNLNNFVTDTLAVGASTPFTAFGPVDRSVVFASNSPYAATTYNGYLYFMVKNISASPVSYTLQDSAMMAGTYADIGAAQTVAAGGLLVYVVKETAIEKFVRIVTAAAITGSPQPFYLGLVDPDLSPITAG